MKVFLVSLYFFWTVVVHQTRKNTRAAAAAACACSLKQHARPLIFRSFPLQVRPQAARMPVQQLQAG
jgi:hypothetical protein